MKGHIRERAPGHWAIILDIHTGTGKRRRKWHSFKGTKREAQRECARLIAEMDQGGYVEPSKQTLGQYLEKWLAVWAPTKAGPKTCERYRHHAKHVIAALGARPIQQVRGGDLNRLYRELAAKGLAPPTVRHIHRLLKRVFARALVLGDVKRNPCDEVDAPTAPVTEAAVLRAEEIPVMLEGLHGILRVIAVVALGTGLRRGELCALRCRAPRAARARQAASRSVGVRNVRWPAADARQSDQGLHRGDGRNRPAPRHAAQLTTHAREYAATAGCRRIDGFPPARARLGRSDAWHVRSRDQLQGPRGGRRRERARGKRVAKR